MPPHHTIPHVDVFISGAGPVGLLLAYQLARQGLRTYIIDAADKASPHFPMYGRACTLYPRTLEMLDQLELFDEMAQVGYIGRRSVTFKEGRRVQGRGWEGLEGVGQLGTYFDFLLNLRLKYSEDVFRGRLEGEGVRVQAPVKLVGLDVDDAAGDEYRVTATCTHPSGTEFPVKAKYIVGCDGGSSAVRKLASIPFIGAEKEDHWVRIDGVVKTNMPSARVGFGTLESKTHGSVLWVALDHSATRIGYVLSPEMYAKYGRHMSKEDAIAEARAAVSPFELDFEQVDWHTVYNVKQRVAERLVERGRVVLAGDAAHVHSSGSAQGMNTVGPPSILPERCMRSLPIPFACLALDSAPLGLFSPLLTGSREPTTSVPSAGDSSAPSKAGTSPRFYSTTRMNAEQWRKSSSKTTKSSPR